MAMTSLGGPAENQLPEEDEEEEEFRYGLGKWKPRCLQAFNNIRWYVLWTSVFSFVQGFIVNGVINAIITSLETRFELPSTRSGLIPSSNNFIALFLVLVISYYGAKRNKPRIIAIGISLVAVGSMLFALPHFAANIYNYRSSEVKENVCYLRSTSPNVSTPLSSMRDNTNDVAGCGLEGAGEAEKNGNVQNYLYVFMLANALHGVGATPMFTLGMTFIDDNTKAERTSWYLGIIYAAASLGVAAGYIAGSQFLNIYTDFDRVDMSTIDITPVDPRWVGAWWVPFLISGVVMLLLILPMAAYPIRLPGSARLLANRKSETYQRKGDHPQKKLESSCKDFPKALLILVENPTFLFLSIASCAEGNIVSGIATFGAKFLQEKFNLPAAYAGFVIGMITVPGAGGGMLLGGYLVKRLKLKCQGIIRLNLAFACVAFLCGALFLVQCPEQHMAGVTIQYNSSQEAEEGPSELLSECNAGCGCTAWVYEPVCGTDGLIYFSPCHAGCDDSYLWMEGPLGPFKMYQNCSCVVGNLQRQLNTTNTTTTTTTTVSPLTPLMGGPDYELSSIGNHFGINISVSDNDTAAPPPGAHQGVCRSDCQLLYVVAPLLFLGMLFTFTTVSPTQTATLRCVPEDMKALAIGFQWLFLRLGGTMPGPLVLGAIIDSACRVWQEACGVQGSCWIYTRHDMGLKIFAWWLLVKGCSVAASFCAQHFYRSPPADAEQENRGGGEGTDQMNSAYRV